MGSLSGIGRVSAISIAVVVIIASVAATVVMTRPGPGATTPAPPPTKLVTTERAGGAVTPQQTTALATTATTAGATAATGATTTAAVQQPGGGVVITVLSRHPTDILDNARTLFLKSDLAKRYGIVDVRTVVLPASAWPEFIRKGQADVLWGGGPTLFDSLYVQKLLAPLEGDDVLSVTAQIPDVVAGASMKRVGADGKIYWVAAAISSFGITINNDLRKTYSLPKPLSWEDLASPEYGSTLVTLARQPSVSLAKLSASTSTTRMAEIIIQAYGWEKGWDVLARIAANSYIAPGSEDARNAVIQGQVAAALTIDFYGYTAQSENPACEYIVPANSTVVNGDPIAMAVSARNPGAARAFIAWVLSAEGGQKIWLDPKINRLPANPAVFSTPEGRSRQDLAKVFNQTLSLRSINFSDEEALSYEIAIQMYFDAAFSDVDADLKAAWKALVSKYLVEKKIDRNRFDELARRYIGSPLEFIDPLTGSKVVFTIDLAKKINPSLSDPRVYDSYKAAISKAAVERYRALYNYLQSL